MCSRKAGGIVFRRARAPQYAHRGRRRTRPKTAKTKIHTRDKRVHDKYTRGMSVCYYFDVRGGGTIFFPSSHRSFFFVIGLIREKSLRSVRR